MSNNNPKLHLALARHRARQSMPYLGSTLLLLSPREAPGLGTVGVTARGILMWDTEAVMKWGVNEFAGVLVHECLHLVLEHHKRFEKVADHERFLANVAQDMAINCLIDQAGLAMPKDSIYPSKYGLPDGQTAEWYFDELRKMQPPLGGEDEQQGQGSGKGGKQGKGSGKCQPRDPGKPQVGAGRCGSCASNPGPGEPEDSDPDGRTDTELARHRRQVAQDMAEHGQKSRGTGSAELDRWSQSVLRPPKIRWQDKLARATRGVQAYAAGMRDYSYRRPSRRYLGAAGANDPLRPSMVKPLPKVVVAVDTSGSMGQADLERAIAEVDGVLKACGTDVRFLACDAEVNAQGRIRTWRQAAALLKGGGGTDFRPVFEEVIASPDRCNTLVFITDGCGPAPDAIPHALRVIWVLVGRYCQRPYAEGRRGSVEYGEFIEVNDGEEDAA